MEVLLLDIEAELSIWDQGRVVWSEKSFPVAELACQLVLWLQGPATGQQSFELDSMQTDAGLIRIASSDGGWRIGSDFTPDFWTSPVAWDALVAVIKQFIRTVRRGVTAMGIEPSFVPAV
ncbi:DUF7878 domain-containing protein [Streptomyces sp. NBC_01237]|uniref:DUF7878 domain-containing protein n=1 Tax=Streptomyces sp. NBC_01237 TaxID=2903790 RepID=UPI002DDC4F23|nr:hypothetical protein [Streptomyces sp. NBC_01237]WRZ78490.1 hypothetical protein OG251_43450 [Streptomyces sp. NBC_01237]